MAADWIRTATDALGANADVRALALACDHAVADAAGLRTRRRVRLDAAACLWIANKFDAVDAVPHGELLDVVGRRDVRRADLLEAERRVLRLLDYRVPRPSA